MMLFNSRRCSSLISNLITISSVIAIITCERGVGVSPPTANLTTLHLVQIIARHGDRAPILPYPKDLYRNASIYSTINGWGELTEIGAKQVYELGAYLRQRYDGFLPRIYRKRDFLMRSSDIDRAIMSAEANLAGLYELGRIPKSYDIFKEWQPVPIHTTPAWEDNFIEAKANCPRYDSLYKEFLQSAEFSSFLLENKAFMDFIVENSGLAAITEDFGEIFQVQDALRCQRLHNLTLPTWANSTVLETLEYFKALSFVWRVKTFEMKRLKVGPLFERLVGEMRAKVEAAGLIISDTEDEEISPYQDPVSYRKMYVYSGHDSTISSLLDSLNLFSPPHIPAYASALIIELHRNPGSGEFFVELLYKNETHVDAGDLHRFDPSLFCGSSSYCSFQNFSSIAHNFISSNWNEECQLQPSASSSPPASPSSFKPSEPLMRAAAPVDSLDPAIYSYDQRFPGKSMAMIHPLGMAPPGLPGFLLTVIAVTSLAASTVLLTSYLRNKQSMLQLRSTLPVSYQHLN